jgi:hypothetical protein
MMTNRNNDKQYKTEAFDVIKKSYFFFYGKKIRDMKKNYFPMCVCVDARRGKKEEEEDEQHIFA